MIRNVLATKRMGFSGRLQGFAMRASKKEKSIPVQNFLQRVMVRVKTNRLYQVSDTSQIGFQAVKRPENYHILFRIINFQGLNWAEIKVGYAGLPAPSLSDLDRIKDEILGKEAYIMVVLRPNIEPCEANIIHCIDGGPVITVAIRPD